jgi:hypothetical protein
MCPDCICPAPEECEMCEVCEEAETVTVTRYVCPDSSIVGSTEECAIQPIEEVSDIKIAGIETAEKTTSWDTIIEPACILGKNGGRIHYETIYLPTTVVVQAKEYGGVYSDVYEFKGLYDAEKAFIICDDGRCYGGDFVLTSGKIHILRLRYQMPDDTLYSKEFIVDLRPGNDYVDRKCAG